MIKFVETDAEKIANEMIKAYESTTGQILYPGDPRRIFLLQFVPILVAAKNDINITANQELLPYAQDQVLDALGQLVGVTRIAAQPAKTTMRFTMSAVQLSDVHIPQGTRVTPDGAAYFYTINDLVIKSGDSFGDIVAESIDGGERYNGYVPGQITIIVDPIPYVASASNTNTSYGGSNQESDDSLRERIRIAPSSFSTAGPEAGYIYHAKSADVNIIDVAVTSPSASTVNVYVLMKNGELPNQGAIDKVTAAVNAKNIRPLTDLVTVLAPTEANYDIELTYYIWTERATEETSIRHAIENSGGSIDQYVEWQQTKLGRAITPDQLLSLMYRAGAARVVITSPVFTEIDANEVAKLGTKNITYGGLI